MTALTTTDRRKGALYGHLVGDALGVTWEFLAPVGAYDGDQKLSVAPAPYEVVGGGPFGFGPGEGSDDTDMLFCALDAYDDEGNFSEDKMIGNMLAWAATRPPDIGGQTLSALTAYFRRSKPRRDEAAQGNGGLMRAAAHPLKQATMAGAADAAYADTLLTHPSREAGYCSAEYAAALYNLIAGESVEDVLADCWYTGYDKPTPERGGHCIHSMKLALWALANVEELGFEETMNRVIATGGDTDTNACIAGALMGAAVGYDAIPERWVAALDQKTHDRAEWLA